MHRYFPFHLRGEQSWADESSLQRRHVVIFALTVYSAVETHTLYFPFGSDRTPDDFHHISLFADDK